MNNTNFFICRDDTIAEVQDCFSRFYPTLEINFFSNIDKTEFTNSCVKFSPEVRVRDMSPGCRDGYIELNNRMTMDHLEHSIYDQFKLHAEISARFGYRYAGSPKTTSRWLKKRNPEGVRLPERSEIAYFNDPPFGR